MTKTEMEAEIERLKKNELNLMKLTLRLNYELELIKKIVNVVVTGKEENDGTDEV